MVKMKQMENMNRSLVEFLNPEIQSGWAVSRSSFTNTSWNILMRALYKAQLIGESGEIEKILLSQLSMITVLEVSDLKHVGNDRLDRLIQELSAIDIPLFEPVGQVSVYEVGNHYSLEQWIILRILKQANWRDEFVSNYGFYFDENIFEDDLIARRIRILELRMNGLTLDEIGKEFGVTRERVRQILNKAFKLVKNDPFLQEKSFSEIVIGKIHSAQEEQSHLEQERKDLIDSRARTFLNSQPGATHLEICRELGVSEKELRQSLQPQTAKFIWSEAREKGNESTYSDDSILEALRLAEAFESPISAPAYRDLVESGLVIGPGPQTVALRFGSWKKACEMAEVSYYESVRTSYEKQWTESEMLEYVIEFLLNKEYGKGIQSYDEWRIETMSNAPSGAHLRKHFGTWIDTKNKALAYIRNNNLDCEL
jgi:predicted transcriptional regulator